jgi:hypothetical protein
MPVHGGRSEDDVRAGALEQGGPCPSGRLALERGGPHPRWRLALERGGPRPRECLTLERGELRPSGYPPCHPGGPREPPGS